MKELSLDQMANLSGGTLYTWCRVGWVVLGSAIGAAVGGLGGGVLGYIWGAGVGTSAC